MTTTQDSAKALETFLAARRESRLVGFLEGDRGFQAKKYKDLVSHPRVQSFPGMLRRHGLVQTGLFLESKDSKDRALWELLKQALHEYTGRDVPPLRELVEQPVELLYFQGQAIETATWIRLVAQARKAKNGADQSAGQGDASPGREEEGGA